MSSWGPTSPGCFTGYMPTAESVSIAVSGVSSVASGVVGAVSASMPSNASLGHFMSYLPGRDDSTVPCGTSGRDKVASVSFDTDEGPAEPTHFLCVCYANGFQIWELLDAAADASQVITQATRETQPLREVVSVRHGPTRLVKMLASAPAARGADARPPALAVVAGEQPGDSNRVRIFSLMTHAYTDEMRFHGEVHGMACNRELLVVSLKNQLLLHALGDLAPLHAFSTFPSPSPMAVLALSRSWLAYPSWQPLRPDEADGVNIAPANSFGSPYVDLGVGVAGSVKTLGEMGAQSIRTLSSYMSSSPPVGCSPLRQPSTEFAGTVTVRDAASGETVLSFRAHDAPIVFLRFDPASSLLVTASVDGHNINLFLLPEFAAGGAAPSPRHLYRLVRGVTASRICDIALSADLRWISVTSSHGTAHVYAINPDGCAPAADTHAPEPLAGPACTLPCCALEEPSSAAGSPRSNFASSRPASARSARSGASLLSEGAAPPLTLFAVTRIRGGDGAAPRGLGDAPVACTKFALGSPAQFGAAGGVGAVYVVSGDGALSRCLLTPPRRADPNGGGGGDALLLTTERQGTFDICRRRRWEEQKCPPELLAAFGAEDAGAPRSPVRAGRPCLRCAQAGCLSRAQSRAPGGADAGSAAGDGAAGAGDTLDEDFLLVEAPRRAQEARLSTSAPSASRNPFMDARAGPPLLCAGGSPEVPRPLSFSFRAAAAGSCAGIYGGLPSPSPGSSPADGGVMGGMMAALVLGAGGAAGPRGHPARGVRSLRVSEQRSSDESESGDEGAGGGARDGAEEEDLAREMMFEIDDLDGDGAADVGGEGTSRARQAGGSGSLGASGGVCLDRESAVVGEEDRDALRREADGGDEAEQGPQSADWEAQCEEDAQSQDWEAESDAAPQGEEVKRERGQIVPIACADPCETGKAAYDDAAPPGGDGAILATSPPEEALGVSPTEGSGLTGLGSGLKKKKKKDKKKKK